MIIKTGHVHNISKRFTLNLESTLVPAKSTVQVKKIYLSHTVTYFDQSPIPHGDTTLKGLPKHRL